MEYIHLAGEPAASLEVRYQASLSYRTPVVSVIALQRYQSRICIISLYRCAYYDYLRTHRRMT